MSHAKFIAKPLEVEAFHLIIRAVALLGMVPEQLLDEVIDALIDGSARTAELNENLCYFDIASALQNLKEK